MRIAIIGAGWYGCHIASALMALGFEIVLLEKADRAMDAASGKNQYRLHQGFHYARNHRTRVQSRDGYSRFMERYARLSAPIEHNIYVIPEQDSLVDFLTYRMIMSASGLEYAEVSPADYGITNCRGGVRVEERLILLDKARDFFTRRLGSAMRLNHAAVSVEPNTNNVLVSRP
jgi:glycine/D-amino acid oxidase-like deaminating enzyme